MDTDTWVGRIAIGIMILFMISLCGFFIWDIADGDTYLEFANVTKNCIEPAHIEWRTVYVSDANGKGGRTELRPYFVPTKYWVETDIGQDISTRDAYELTKGDKIIIKYTIGGLTKNKYYNSWNHYTGAEESQGFE